MTNTITGDYFAHPATSYSKLKVLSEDPLEYWASFEATPALMTSEDSEAKDRGHIAHAACLEPHRLNELYVEYPKGMLSGESQSVSSNEAKAFRDAARAAGIIPMKPRDMEIVRRMVTGLLQSDYGEWFEMPSLMEQAVTWTEIVDGVEVFCKAKLDLLFDLPHRDRNLIVDLKFIRNASDRGFAEAAAMWKYPIQDAQYRRAAEQLLGKPADLYFLAIQDHPAGVRVALHEFEEGSEERAYGEGMRSYLLADLVRRRETNDWRTSWEKKINRVRMSPYQMKIPTQAA